MEEFGHTYNTAVFICLASPCLFNKKVMLLPKVLMATEDRLCHPASVLKVCSSEL